MKRHGIKVMKIAHTLTEYNPGTVKRVNNNATHTCARTHTRIHACLHIHTHTQSVGQLEEMSPKRWFEGREGFV